MFLSQVLGDSGRYCTKSPRHPQKAHLLSRSTLTCAFILLHKAKERPATSDRTEASEEQLTVRVSSMKLGGKPAEDPWQMGIPPT